MIKQRKCRGAFKYGEDPKYAKHTGSDDRRHGGIERMTLSAQTAGGNLIKIAYRLKKKDAEDTHRGALDYCGICGK